MPLPSKPIPEIDSKRIEAFRKKILPPDANGCWNWAGAKYHTGYGVFKADRNQPMLAHRVAWVIARGPIPDGMLICHSCDNRSCVNPSHFFLGGHAENLKDMRDKGRGVIPKGEHNGRSVLTEESVIEIRRLYSNGGWSNRSLAKEYGIDRSQISRIVNRKTWKSV